MPNKNILPLNGKPLISYSIEHTISTPVINRIIVSTDSKEYAKTARNFGAETPFIRPKNISNDDSTDFEVFFHALNILSKNGEYFPDIIVHLRPPSPIRKIEDISNCINLLIKNPDAESVRSVVTSPYSPYKMWEKNGINGTIKPFAVCEVPEAHSVSRQSLPKVYLHNGCIDVIRSEVITKK